MSGTDTVSIGMLQDGRGMSFGEIGADEYEERCPVYLDGDLFCWLCRLMPNRRHRDWGMTREWFVTRNLLFKGSFGVTGCYGTELDLAQKEIAYVIHKLREENPDV